MERRFDAVFLVGGLPLVIGEAKTPSRSAVTWFDGAFQINEIYERQSPAMFVLNIFSFATEGKLFRYGPIRMPVDTWGPWRDEENQEEGQFHHVKASVTSMFRPEVVLDILQPHRDASPHRHPRPVGGTGMLTQAMANMVTHRIDLWPQCRYNVGTRNGWRECHGDSGRERTEEPLEPLPGVSQER